METIGQRLKRRRLEKDLSQEELARRAGVTQGTIQQQEDIPTRKSKHLPAIAVALGTTAEYLATGKNPPAQTGINQDSATYSVQNIKTARPQNRPVPVISLIRAGNMKEIGELPRPGEGDVWESPDYKLGPRGWAHIVEGDSMDDGTSKGIPEGYLLFVDPDIAPQAGNFVIAKDVTTQSATFKKLIIDGGRWYLKPLNRQYQAIEIDSPELRVIGVVTEVRAPSRRLI